MATARQSEFDHEIRFSNLSRKLEQLIGIKQDVTKLQLWTCHIHPSDVGNVLNYLMPRKLTVLDLSHNFIGEHGAKYLANHLFQKFPQLEMLNLTDNGINYDGAEALIKAVGNRKVRIILDGNQFSLASRQKLLLLAKKNDQVKLEIKLAKTANVLQVPVADALNTLNSFPVKKLKLSQNLNDAQIKQIINAIAENQLFSLEEVDLSGNKMSDENAIALARVLKQCPELRVVNLENNNISARGVTALADVVRTNENLQQLNLTNNQVDDAGVIALLNALPEKRAFNLNVSANKIGVEGIKLLLQAEDKHFHALRFADNEGLDIWERTKQQALNTVMIQKRLRELDAMTDSVVITVQASVKKDEADLRNEVNSVMRQMVDRVEQNTDLGNRAIYTLGALNLTERFTVAPQNIEDECVTENESELGDFGKDYVSVKFV